MARNGSGTYVVYTPGNPVVTGTTISSTAFNNTINDIATALTGSISADGQTPITANIPMNSHKLTGLAAPTVAGDALSYGGVVAGSTGAFTSSALGTQVIATNGGTTTLTSTSPYYTVFTGTFVQNLVLPDATTLTVGQQYGIDNDGSLAITVKTNGGATLWTIASGCDLYLTLTAQATAVGTWETDYQGAQLATGKTLVVNNSVTVNGTDSTTMTLPTTSTTIARTDAAQTFTGAQTFNSTIGGATTIGVGAATPSASGAGITFPTTQSASTNANTLDDYEEGTWVIGSTGTGTAATTGWYTKIGNQVTCWGAIYQQDVSAPTTFTGLPFTSNAMDGNNNAGGYCLSQSGSAAGTFIGIQVTRSSTQFQLLKGPSVYAPVNNEILKFVINYFV